MKLLGQSRWAFHFYRQLQPKDLAGMCPGISVGDSFYEDVLWFWFGGHSADVGPLDTVYLLACLAFLVIPVFC